MLLEIEAKEILIIKQQRTRLNSVLLLGESRTQLGDLVEISKPSVEGVAWFLFIAYSKFQEERNKLRKELLNVKEFSHLWGSTLIQIAKIRKFTVEKTHSGESTKDMTEQCFAEEIGYGSISAEARNSGRVIREVSG